MDVEIDKKIKPHLKGVRSAYVVEKLKQDLVSVFKENYYVRFNMELSNYTRKMKLPWKNNKKIICIHIRLDDRTNQPDYNGKQSADYINGLIETNRCGDYDRNVLKSKDADTQAPINVNKLKLLLYKLKNDYPDKEFHIIKKGNINRYRDLINQYNIKVHENDLDRDLWLLINSEILVTSKSFFSQMAMYFHTGSKIYVPYWGSGAASGLMSKYNKTNVEFYV